MMGHLECLDHRVQWETRAYLVLLDKKVTREEMQLTNHYQDQKEIKEKEVNLDWLE